MRRPPPELETLRYSGFRLKYKSQQEANYLWAQMSENMKHLAPLAEALRSEPFYIDDSLRDKPAHAVLMGGLQAGELFVYYYEGRLACIIFLSDIRPGRDAYFEGWSHPDFRVGRPERRAVLQAGKNCIEYAFKPFGHELTDGLGLAKLKARITAPNRKSFKSAIALGFRQFGMSPLDTLHFGVPYDTLMLERLNPLYFHPVAEIIPNVIQGRPLISELRTGSAVCSEPDLHSPAELPASELHEPWGIRQPVEPADDDTERRNGDAGSAGRGSDRIDPTPVAPTRKREPIKSRRDSGRRNPILQPERSAADKPDSEQPS